MKKTLIAMAIVALTACNAKHDNPVLADSALPFGAPEFAKYQSTDYEAAFMEGLAEQRAEIDAIVAQTEAPTFDNTIAALERSGKKLAKVSGVFYNLNETDADDVMRETEKKLSPILTEHSAYMTMNEALFARVKALYDTKASLGLTREQEMVLDKYYRMFVKGGALLDAEKKAQLMEIDKQLSLASIEFGENALAETNAFELVITDEKDLAGLPQSSINAAREAAQAAGKEGWLFTLHKPSWIPFLQYADNRELRKQMYLGYINRGDNNNENDNKAVIARILKLRQQKARLFGYETFAQYQLEDKMAKTPEAAYNLLMTIWNAALPKAKAEAAELQKMMDAEGKGEKLEAWDWWYYAEKVRKQKYDLNEELTKPYFKLENVLKGIFIAANTLYGLNVEELKDVPSYNSEVVTTYKITDADGSLLGIFTTDYLPRASKRGGAWMNNVRDQYVDAEGNMVRPIIVNVGNLSEYLTIDEVGTVFHEFGHALHGLLSQCHYASVSGTSVVRDFVETFSQFNENWAFQPELLAQYAINDKGEVIPAELVEKINNSLKFNQGFMTTELCAASILDMKWHELESVDGIDIEAFEEKVCQEMGLIPEIGPRYRTTYFNHIFSSGYSAGYYGYLWAEVLDKDLFSMFEASGNVWNKELATKFRQTFLEKGGSEEPMKLFQQFAGRLPDNTAFLKRRGLK